VSELLAPDPAVPTRDALLDAPRMAALLGERLTGTAATGERVNAKYRVGESLRVAYRLDTSAGTRTVAGRTFRGRSARAFRRAADAAIAVDGLPPVLHLPELDAVFWTFPNDRRLERLSMLAGGAALDRLVGGSHVRTRLVAYAPERAATAECFAAGRGVLAYLKLHWDAVERERAAAEAAFAAIGDRHPRLHVPRVLAASAADGALVLEPLRGRRLDRIGEARLGPALRALGAALATLHREARPPGRRFDRLDGARLAQAVDVIGRARPGCRSAAERLHARLLARGPEGEAPAVHLHGDANLRNALYDGRRIALVDLEDAAAGPAAADLGFVLAGLLAAQVQGHASAGERAARGRELLDGYAEVAAPPRAPCLRWFTAATALARVAVPAVGRVRPAALASLEPLLRVAAEELP
jgi:aminoglycoside phosphotransferase (APT) family kinase protein